MKIIKNCKDCELTSDSCNCVCLDLAAAPTQVVPTSTGSQRPFAYYHLMVNGFFVQSVNLIKWTFTVSSSQSDAFKFRTSTQLAYLKRITDYLDSTGKSYQVQFVVIAPTPLSIGEQSK